MPDCKLVVPTSMCSRHRKQRFPRLDRRRLHGNPYVRASVPEDECLLSEDVHHFSVNKRFVPTQKTQIGTSTASFPSGNPASTSDSHDGSLPITRGDRRARDEHNEQERNRRRELAIIYELIRCSFSEDDLRYIDSSSTSISIEKMSYPQVLHVAYHLLREEHHNLLMFERTLNDIRRIEKEFIHAGIQVPQRPALPSISETYLRLIETVDRILKYDKSARTSDGVYEVTPAERAALGDRQLTAVCPKSSFTHQGSLSPGTGFSRFKTRRARHSVRMSRKPVQDGFSTLKCGETSKWARVVTKLRRSSSSASVPHQTSDSDVSFLQENSVARYVYKPEDRASLVFGEDPRQMKEGGIAPDFHSLQMYHSTE